MSRPPRRRIEIEGLADKMTDSNDKPTLGRKPLGLKSAVVAGEVKQTFSHGRTNKVVVEVKRRKVLGKPGEAGGVVHEAPAAEVPRGARAGAATAAGADRAEEQLRSLPSRLIVCFCSQAMSAARTKPRGRVLPRNQGAD